MAASDFFEIFCMTPVTAEGFDSALAGAGDSLVAVYFWGSNCFNCEQFKKAAQLQAGAISELNLKWFHADVYAETALGHRFGLHGVPTFYFFHHGRKLGRVTSWPGLPQFTQAVKDLHTRISAPVSANDKAGAAVN